MLRLLYKDIKNASDSKKESLAVIFMRNVSYILNSANNKKAFY